MHHLLHPTTQSRRQPIGQRGVSLIEALVALAVMAFGILGVVGVQLTLRNNGDVAKQRAQAVRIAQEAIEEWRSFTVLALPPGPTPHTRSYAMIATAASAAVPSSMTGTTNTAYEITRAVTTTADPPSKSVQVTVGWPDRTGAMQSVVLTSRIAGILPELSGSLSVPARSLNNQQLRGRNSAIPVTAVDLNDGSNTSTFTPPGAATGITWVFNNTTGLITSLCNPFPGSCTPSSATLLSGFVRFTFGTSPPNGANAEFPTTPTPTSPFTFDIEVHTAVPPATVTPATLPSATSVVLCYEQFSSAWVAYHCAVPLPAAPATAWNGTTVMTGLTLATTVASDTDATHFRVCRYTSAPDNATVVSNVEHPLSYSNVSTSLINQNFLLIQAGNGSVVFACPGDDTTTPFISGNTLPHQPAS